MRTYNTKGMTLVEALISICLISVLLIGTIGAYVISRLAVDRAKHRMMAMNKIREYMEREVRAGYLGGFGRRPDDTEDADYYVTVDSGDAIKFVIDDTGSAVLEGTIKPEPYSIDGTGYTYEEGTPPNSCRYKKVGFVVEWKEKLFGGASMPTSRERTAAYVADHN